MKHLTVCLSPIFFNGCSNNRLEHPSFENRQQHGTIAGQLKKANMNALPPSSTSLTDSDMANSA